MYQSNLQASCHYIFYLDVSSSVLSEDVSSMATDGEASSTIIDQSSLNVANNERFIHNTTMKLRVGLDIEDQFERFDMVEANNCKRDNELRKSSTEHLSMKRATQQIIIIISKIKTKISKITLSSVHPRYTVL